MFAEVVATICLVWFIAVMLVCAIGYTQLRRWYSAPPARAVCEISLPDEEVPQVTIIRPVKGLEPSLYECLASTFRQTYPQAKLTIYFCIFSRDDPAFPTLERVLADFPTFDAKLLVEADDPALQRKDGGDQSLGPNPKIRNMSRAYREARGDIVWIIDCNVWVAKGVCGRMVDTLCGYGSSRMKNKFVHQLPLVVDTVGSPAGAEIQSLLNHDGNEDLHVSSTSTASHALHTTQHSSTGLPQMWHIGGGRLEELFMSSSHAKFYTAINTVLLAPCIVGKSTMFRRSHLNSLTEGQGIDFFSHNICEDHLIGDLLWKQQVPEEKRGEKWGKHAMVFGDLAVQPMAGMSVGEYAARRIRWLRVRKFTVTLATLVEPGTESLLCSAYGAFAVTTLPWFHRILGLPQTWTAFWLVWLLFVGIWAAVDWTLYRKLHSAASIEVDEDTPSFARPPTQGTGRPFKEWLAAWLGREMMAFPIWAWAVFGGVTVTWRGRRFWVGMDMRVHEVKLRGKKEEQGMNGHVVVGGVKARSD
ncbi:Ceramide glucosyltransferase [Coniosporium apollinis]|uniref:Ceramide glucosyltransferase n=1 Tax=Coniosporium apollinis TaxID=61459 RepID=A0ABQ9NM41_9PEZI|nr:Ceramide glucosyltransferase [Coniosporium apollinis]